MRSLVESWLRSGVAAVDPVQLTADAISGDRATLIAIGKAAVGMCVGAARSIDSVSGVCVSDGEGEAPSGIEILVGDHPVPGLRSVHAGRAVLETARQAEDRLVALVSGGGSALCESPRSGVELGYIEAANRALLEGGASIEETNLVRGHLSEVKCGGLARAASLPVETYVLSDVAGAGPEVVASGPTLSMRFEPDLAISILERCGLPVPERVRSVMSVSPGPPGHSTIEVLADGMTAANAVAAAARADSYDALVQAEWLSGDVVGAVDRFIDDAGPGVTIISGETVVTVGGDGSGGRNTHAALLAATRIAGSDCVFAAFATDGIDGHSSTAGAIVDGATLDRGGDPARAIEEFDTASYLATVEAVIPGGRTGTNVADIWVMVRP